MNLLKKSHLFLTVGLAAGLLLTGCGQPPGPAKVIEVGDKAAGFSLPDSSGHFMKLSDVQPGWYLVLVFYRGSWCPHCTNELLNLKKDIQRFPAFHAALAAVDAESIGDLAAFNDQWRFPFPLLSDSQLQLIDAYGLRQPKGGNHGQDVSQIAIIVIDPQKVVRYKFVGKDATDWHPDDDLFYVLQDLQAGKPASL